MESKSQNNLEPVKLDIIQESTTSVLVLNIEDIIKKEINETELEAIANDNSTNNTKTSSPSSENPHTTISDDCVKEEYNIQILDNDMEIKMTNSSQTSGVNDFIEVSNSGVDFKVEPKIEHTGENSYECSKCNEKFNVKRLLRIHMKCHDPETAKVSHDSSNKKQYKCDDCGYKCVLKSRWMRHTKPDLTKELKSCEICKQQYSRRACLQEHRLKRHSRRIKIRPSHQCELCNKKFQCSNYLKVHMRTHTGEKPYKCSECDRKFISNNLLKNHILTHKPATQFPCEFCDKKFRIKAQYLLHLNTHTREKIYECSKCDKKFLLRGSFQEHMRGHSEEKLRIKPSHQCKHCNKKFQNGNYLKVHMRTHTGEKPYECSECHEKLISKAKLKDHMLFHKPATEFSCQFCNKKFRRKSNYKQHLNIHTREKIYECSKCDKKINGKQNFRDHLKSHSKIGFKLYFYACHYCEKSFVHNRRLEEHMKEVHRENKPKIDKQTTTVQNKLQNQTSLKEPFQCLYCPATFRAMRLFNMHMILHLGVKPFQCAKCFKRFPFQHRLLRHESKPCRLKTSSSSSSENEHNTSNDDCVKVESNMKMLDNEMETRKTDPSQKSGVRDFKQTSSSSSFENAHKIPNDDCVKVESNMEMLDNEMETRKTDTSQTSGIRDFKQIEQSRQCKVCNKIFKRSNYLKVHMKTHTTPYECSECHTKFRTYHMLKGHMLAHNPVPQTCKICNKTLAGEETIKIHMLTHHREYLHTCPKCDKVLYNQHNLNDHLKVHEKVGLKFACHCCEKSFIYYIKLEEHIEFVHGEENKPKIFNHTTSLEKGFQIHTLDELKTCKICNKTLAGKETIKIHMRTHYGEKVYKCTKCDKVSYNQHNVNDHLRAHEKVGLKFACQFCEKCFIKNTKLRKHMREVHKENTDKIVKQTNSLENDLQNHTSDELKFACHCCEKSFIYYIELEEHIKEAHGDENKPKIVKQTTSLENDFQIHILDELKENPENQNIASGNSKEDCQLNERKTSSTTEHVDRKSYSYLDAYISFLPKKQVQSVPWINSVPDKAFSNIEKLPTSSKHIEMLKPDKSNNEIITNAETIKVEDNDLIDVAFIESITTEKNKHTIQEIGSSSLSNTYFEDSVCKEEVILPTELI